mmetsp:Transcript_107542/g.301177  ORF Transcript_107542/g.301177 Transcript_107542/m.301177 type:complete len:263 (+) Transcript_107542:48-836(+)
MMCSLTVVRALAARLRLWPAGLDRVEAKPRGRLADDFRELGLRRHQLRLGSRHGALFEGAQEHDLCVLELAVVRARGAAVVEQVRAEDLGLRGEPLDQLGDEALFQQAPPLQVEHHIERLEGVAAALQHLHSRGPHLGGARAALQALQPVGDALRALPHRGGLAMRLARHVHFVRSLAVRLDLELAQSLASWRPAVLETLFRPLGCAPRCLRGGGRVSCGRRRAVLGLRRRRLLCARKLPPGAQVASLRGFDTGLRRLEVGL